MLKFSETIESQREELHRAQAERHRQDHQLLHEQLWKKNLDFRKIRDATPDRQPEIKSILVREDF